MPVSTVDTYQMQNLFIVSLLLVSFLANAQASDKLNSKIQHMLEHSFPRLACNMSVGDPGAVIASPENKAPDYYFHWVRDSALIVDSLNRLIPKVEGTATQERLHQYFADFSRFSEKLQNTKSQYKDGEVRFLVDGGVDNSEWPRPQHDGPALRALALMHYLESNEKKIPGKTVAQMRKVIRRDLASVVRHYNDKGFDLWEYSNGFHFYTRMVQLSALERGQRFFGPNLQWKGAAGSLRRKLDRHWSEKQGVILFNDGLATDDKGKPIPRWETRHDTSVALAVNHAALEGDGYGNLDPRIWTTLEKLENYFRTDFPVNKNRQLGPAVGRHPGDGYYGGNAFFFLTSAFSEHNLRIAREFENGKGTFVADAKRLPTLRRVLGREVKEGEVFTLPNKELAQAFTRNGEAFLETMLDSIPADGMVAEQLNKVDGSPASARDLSWSYTSILAAMLQREENHPSGVDFKKIEFKCPTERFKASAPKEAAEVEKAPAQSAE